jgi:uncharacterized membrane protein YeaQ/YmgE (transglycosylase-associated protein family)
MDLQDWIILVVIGGAMGWLVNRLNERGGLGTFGDMATGVAGAVAGWWALPKLGIYLTSGEAGFAARVALGAFILLALVRIIRRI